MATLVLSTLGNALGGPVGGAIGSLIGQGIDQQIFGSGPRRGPRLGDLSVQTSSYGTAIPKVFGSMRVAGTVVWSTDLVENSETEAAKGEPGTVTYSYSVSLAVALSSRPIKAVGRIWADGNLIRTADGQFTIETGFRIADGSEDQPIDPLIGSVEGVDGTPAYRGVALAIFDGLQLGSFGNRIPFFTFEVIADDAPLTIEAILSEISDGVVRLSDARLVQGFAAYGETVGAAVEAIAGPFGSDMVEDGTVLRSPGGQVLTFNPDDAGCAAGEEHAPHAERSQIAAASLPSAITLAYYDRERDYQSNSAQAALELQSPKIERLDVPAVLDVSAAKAMAETLLARRWSERDRMTVRLPGSYLSVRPGDLIRPSIDADAWKARQVKLDAMVAVIELSPVCEAATPVTGSAGRVLPADASMPTATHVMLAELPDDGSGASDHPVLAIAVERSAQAVPLQVGIGAAPSFVRKAPPPAIIGEAVNVLMDGQAALLDRIAHVDVRLNSGNGWLQSCDLDALGAGANLALLGDELIQFGEAQPIGGSDFRLSQLLRGRGGTEWAMSGHSAGDRFLLIERSRIDFLPLSASDVGARVEVTPLGLADAGVETVTVIVAGEALRPPSPVHLKARFDPEGGLDCSWVRRCRQGWQWLDGVDSPLGAAREMYRVTLSANGTSIEKETAVSSLRFEAEQLASLGGGDLQLEVVQVGDLAVSRAATATIVKS